MFFQIIVFFLLIQPIWSHAGGGDGIPVRFVFFQILNFSLFTLALFFLLRRKLPEFLKQKREDFVQYQRKAKKLEKEHQAICLSLEKKVQVLQNKESNMEQSVVKALNNLKEEMRVREKNDLDNLKVRARQEMERVKIKELNRLKTRVLFQVMEQTRRYLRAPEQAKSLEELNYQIIQKWGRM